METGSTGDREPRSRGWREQDDGVSARGLVDAAFRMLDGVSGEGMSVEELAALAAGLGRLQAKSDWLLCRVAQWAEDAAPGIDAGEMLRQATGLAARDTRKVTRVTEHLPDMPEVEERFASGDMTLGHAAVMADAAEKLDPEVVDSSAELMEMATRMPVDLFRRRTRAWTARQVLQAGTDILEHQRKCRRGSVWTDRLNGMRVFRFEMDPVSAGLVEETIDVRYHKLRMADAGADQNPNEVRTTEQRLADAFFEIVTGRDASTHLPLPDTAAGGGRAVSPAMMVVKVDLAELDGVNPTGQVEVIGAGPVPREVLRTLSPDTELVSTIFSGPGRVLWMGRKTRLANAPQRLAVAVRDGGCFECGMPMHRCQLHHAQEWRRDRGRTDVDNLVAVCPRHHRWIADQNLVVRRVGNGWQAQPRDGP